MHEDIFEMRAEAIAFHQLGVVSVPPTRVGGLGATFSVAIALVLAIGLVLTWPFDPSIDAHSPIPRLSTPISLIDYLLAPHPIESSVGSPQ